MGIGGSKSSCISFSLHGSKSNSKSHASRSNGEKEFLPSIETEHSGLQPAEATEGSAVRKSRQSLRKVSSHSIKPGKLSLQSSHPVLKVKEVSQLFDPEDLISIHDLYNMLNDGAMKPYIHDPYNILIIDSRDLNFFSPSHVITAKHHASVLGNTPFTSKLPNYSMVVIYGSELSDNRDTQELESVRNDIAEYVASDILILKEGFDLFQATYPFLCTDREIESVSDRRLLTCYPSTVLEDQLFQGRGDQATNETIIDLLKITHIVNITLEHKNAFPGKVKYIKIALDDVSKTNLFSHFYETSDFINNAISKGGKVLVHCNMGVSRSSTITLSYLMRFKQWNLDHAFSLLKARRSCACPNDGFFKQLSKWEVEMFGKRITDIDSI